jgi:hypothetical protein
MHDKDKNLLQEDDTGSFEAMEIRLKTPRKQRFIHCFKDFAFKI